jgi:hypothetical protein
VKKNCVVEGTTIKTIVCDLNLLNEKAMVASSKDGCCLISDRSENKVGHGAKSWSHKALVSRSITHVNLPSKKNQFYSF